MAKRSIPELDRIIISAKNMRDRNQQYESEDGPIFLKVNCAVISQNFLMENRAVILQDKNF